MSYNENTTTTPTASSTLMTTGAGEQQPHAQVQAMPGWKTVSAKKSSGGAGAGSGFAGSGPNLNFSMSTPSFHTTAKAMQAVANRKSVVSLDKNASSKESQGSKERGHSQSARSPPNTAALTELGTSTSNAAASISIGYAPTSARKGPKVPMVSSGIQTFRGPTTVSSSSQTGQQWFESDIPPSEMLERSTMVVSRGGASSSCSNGNKGPARPTAGEGTEETRKDAPMQQSISTPLSHAPVVKSVPTHVTLVDHGLDQAEDILPVLPVSHHHNNSNGGNGLTPPPSRQTCTRGSSRGSSRGSNRRGGGGTSPANKRRAPSSREVHLLPLSEPVIYTDNLGLHQKPRPFPQIHNVDKLQSKGAHISILMSEIHHREEETQQVIQAMQTSATAAQRELQHQYELKMQEQHEYYSSIIDDLRSQLHSAKQEREQLAMMLTPSTLTSEVEKKTASLRGRGGKKHKGGEGEGAAGEGGRKDDLYGGGTSPVKINCDQGTQAPELPEDSMSRAEVEIALKSLFARKDDILDLMHAHSNLKEVMRHSDEARNLLRYGKIPTPPAKVKLMKSNLNRTKR